MSEEEIIKNTRAILENWQKILDIEDDIERDIEMNCYIEEMPFKELQGLLDLYQKEKEKNIVLGGENIGKQLAINQLHSDIKEQSKNSISKDKIRELIDKRGNNGYTSLDCIEDIEELLEERK